MPIYSGAVIDFGLKTSENNLLKFGLIVKSDKPVTEVADYYIGQLKNAKDYREISLGQGFTSMEGEKGGYKFTVATSPGDDNKGTLIQIQLTQLAVGSSSGSSSTGSTGTPGHTTSVDASIPAGYPASLMPIIGGAKVTVGVKDVSGSKTEYFVEYEVAKSIKDVYNHYLPLLKNATDFDEWDNEPGYAMAGAKGGYEFAVQIRPVDPENLNKGSIVCIHLQQQ